LGETIVEKTFEIILGGTSYECIRKISGIGVQKQCVEVVGVGSKADAAIYGTTHHPTEAMLSTARKIASEIIRESRKTS
jgi:hypothetical protein